MGNIAANDAVVTELNSLGRFDGSKLSAAARETIHPPLNEIHGTVRDLLALVKYHLRHFDLREHSYSVRSEHWITAAGVSRDIPTTLSASIDVISSQPLDETTRGAVQSALDAGMLPLIAMRHLHRANFESEPHHKWIDATIAAELAVKEVLCRAHPEIEPLLVELPSPPLSKLYGPLLTRYLGEASPFRKQLIAGQENRNVLVHRPGALEIGAQEANDYVAAVEGAIFHLLSLLYPQDALVMQAHHRTTA